MKYRAGQKIVYVDDSPLTDGRPHPFKCGTVKTIERIGPCSINCCGFSLVGEDLFDGRWFYCSERWRLAVDRETNISFAHEILRKASKKDKRPIEEPAHG